MVGVAIVTMVGYAILLGTTDDWSSSSTSSGSSVSGVRYFACFLCINCYTFVGLNVSLQSTNQAGSSKRAMGTGLQLAIGNAGGIVAGQLYPTGSNNNYTMGFAVSIGLTAFSTVLYLINWVYLSGMNRARDRVQEEQQQQLGSTTTPNNKDFTRMMSKGWIGPGLRPIPGDRSLTFRYNL